MTNKTYKVLRIDEDIDFGCEERQEGQPVQAIVTLLDEEENECVVKVEDRLLYERDINEGDEVFLDWKQELEKGSYLPTIYHRLTIC